MHASPEVHIVDNRVFLLGLDELYRKAMKRIESVELLACAAEARTSLSPVVGDPRVSAGSAAPPAAASAPRPPNRMKLRRLSRCEAGGVVAGSVRGVVSVMARRSRRGCR